MEHLSFTYKVMTSELIYFFHSPTKNKDFIPKKTDFGIVLEFQELPKYDIFGAS